MQLCANRACSPCTVCFISGRGWISGEDAGHSSTVLEAQGDQSNVFIKETVLAFRVTQASETLQVSSWTFGPAEPCFSSHSSDRSAIRQTSLSLSHHLPVGEREVFQMVRRCSPCASTFLHEYPPDNDKTTCTCVDFVEHSTHYSLSSFWQAQEEGREWRKKKTKTNFEWLTTTVYP